MSPDPTTTRPAYRNRMPIGFRFHRGLTAWPLFLVFAMCGCAGSSAKKPKTSAPGLLNTPTSASASNETPKQNAAAAAPLPFRLPCQDHDVAGCTKGCEDEQTEDCTTLASMYLKGEVILKDQERAIAMLRDTCEKGSARGCMRLGDAYHEGLLRDESEEANCYRRACEAGANSGCVAAAKAFLEGKGVSVDAVRGAALLKRACERGNMWGCFELARLHERGEGVPKNAERARELFLKACNLGLDQGCLLAGPIGEVAPPRN